MTGARIGAAIGAVLLLAVGFWIGRNTAEPFVSASEEARVGTEPSDEPRCDPAQTTSSRHEGRLVDALARAIDSPDPVDSPEAAPDGGLPEPVVLAPEEARVRAERALEDVQRHGALTDESRRALVTLAISLNEADRAALEARIRSAGERGEIVLGSLE